MRRQNKNEGSMRNKTSRNQLAAHIALMLFSCGTANAQELATPSVRQLVDVNGVDLMSGQFSVQQSIIDIGPPEANLSYSSSDASSRDGSTFYRASTDVLLKFFNPPEVPSSYVAVSVGGSVEKFDPVTFAAQNGMGSTLVFDTPSQSYIYTRRNGTVIRFPAAASNGDWNGQRALSILEPNGALTEFSNKNVGVLRVQSVVNNAGYQLKFEYPGPDSGRTSKAYVLNRAVAYCDPAADTCAATSGAPFATMESVYVAYTPQLTVTDAAGRQTRWTMGAYHYGAVSGPSSVKSRASSVDDVTATFENFGTGPFGVDVVGVTSVTRRGQTWDYQILNYSIAMPIVKVTDPGGNSREVTTDIIKTQVVSDKDGLGRVTSYQYDSFGRQTRITYPEGNYVQLAYDARGNLTEVRRVAKPGAAISDIVESAVYPATCSNPKTCNKPTSITNARGKTTDYTYDSTHGGVLTVTEPAPFSGGTRPQTRYSYTALYAWYKNSAGTLVQSATPIYKLTGVSSCRTAASCANTADEVKTTFNYQVGSASVPSNLLLTSVVQSSGDGALSAVTTMSYDDRGNRVAVDGPLAGTADTVTTRYDVLRRVVGVVGPDPDGAGVLKRRAVRYSYNADDSLTVTERGTVNGLGESDWSAFSTLEQVNFGYDAAGRRSSASIIAGGSTMALTQFSYDAAGRIECTARRMNPAAFGSAGSACSHTSSGSFGPDRITKALYNAAGQIWKVQAGYGTAAQRDETTSTYTNNGQLQTITDARNGVTTYEYDRYDRLYRTRYPSSAGVSSTTDFEQFLYDIGGNVIERRLRDGQVIGFVYDDLGRLQTRNLPGAELDITYGYDNLGHTTSAAQSGHTLTFGYDSLGRLRTQTGPQGTLTSDHDSAGRRSRLTWPDAFYVEYDYLVTGEMTAIRENGVATGINLLASYGYDDLGRRTGLTRGNGTSTSYGYDAASRLQSLVQNLAASAADQSVGMSYNPAYQISTRTSNNDAYAWTGNQSTLRNDTPNLLNQYTAIGSTTPTYDSRGNLTSFGTGAYTYSSENMLTSAPGSVSLSYDPLGRLHQTSSAASTTRFSYDGDRLVAEYNASNQLLRRYVHGPAVDEPVVWYEGSGTSTRRWLHADERGSIVAISNASGAQFAINRYDEYGVPAATNAGRFQFTGQSWVAEVGFYYYKARFYAPLLGRFLQVDPIGYAGGMNRYAYVGGDPVNLRDPTGLLERVVTTASRDCGWDCSSFDPDVFEELFGYQQDFIEHLIRATETALAEQQHHHEKQKASCDKDFPVLTTAVNAGVGVLSGEVGTISVIDWSARSVHTYAYAALGAGLSAPVSSWAASVEIGSVFNFNSPSQLSGWGWGVSGFAAAGAAGVAGQYFTNFSLDYHGVTGGYAAGLGATVGIAGSHTWYEGTVSFGKASKDVKKFIRLCGK